MSADPQLPRLAARIVRLVVPATVRDEVEGDLSERYREIHAARGASRARRWLARQLLGLSRWSLGAGRRHGGSRGASPLTSGWGTELRRASRTLARRPTAAATVVVTIALAIAATTSAYSVIDGVLLRPLPYPDSGELVRVWQTRAEWSAAENRQLRSYSDAFPLSPPTFEDWRSGSTGFESLGAFDDLTFVVSGPAGPEVVPGMVASSGYFTTLGTEPLLGRSLVAADDSLGAERVVVIGEGFWLDRFGGAVDVLGRSVTLDGVPHGVVGVMPAEFAALVPETDLWTPFTEAQKMDGRNSRWISVVGRLPSDGSRELVADRLASLQAEIGRVYPDIEGPLGTRMVPLLDSVLGDVASTLWLVAAAVGLVLLVAVLNVANVLTVLGLSRRHEVAVRAAMGAARVWVARTALAESVVLAGLGGALGVVLAWLGLPWLVRVIPADVPRYEGVAINSSVLLFGLGITATTALALGTLPALQAARTHPGQALRSISRGSTAGRLGSRLRSLVVSLEIGLSFVLLVAAGLLGTSLSRLWSEERGFVAEDLLVMLVTPDGEAYPTADDRDRFVRELRARLETIPGTEVSAAASVPLAGNTSLVTFEAERPEGEPERFTAVINVVEENFIDVMRIPLMEGRALARTDGPEAPRVALVNQAMARALWPGQSALGKRFADTGDDEPWIEVVGVVGDVAQERLGEEVDPKVYLPAGQSGRTTSRWILRTRGDAQATLERARREVVALSPSTPVRGTQVLETTIRESVAVARFRTVLLVGLAILAAGLALLGVYGVVAHGVAERRREIGLRIALGSSLGAVVGRVVGSGLKLSLVGVGAGLALCWPAARYLSGFLHRLSPWDARTYFAVALVVTLVAVGASLVPALGAARVDPKKALGTE